MRILVLGATGFVGGKVAKILEHEHEIVTTNRMNTNSSTYLDLLQPETIRKTLTKIQPDVIIHCAGIVENTEAANQNPIFTRNLLGQVVALGLVPRIIISGSAAEYGLVHPKNIPVKESTPLNATSIYGISKIEETRLALNIRNEHKLPIVVARIFNPIGVGMQPKFLTSRIIQQIKEIRSGTRQTIEVSRLDSERDYIDITDLAKAIKMLSEGNPKEAIYNIGSGKATSNGRLIELLINGAKLSSKPDIIETSLQPEPIVATRADISRLQEEFGWSPGVTLEVTVKEIIDNAE